MTKTIPLTKDKTTLIDDCDFERVACFKWHYHSAGYAARSIISGKGKSYAYMHRVIAGADDSQQVDHINGDRLDNRRENLRLATGAQNSRNAKRPVTNKSGYKGVSWSRITRKWQAQIQINRRGKHLGFFFDAVEAARAYDRAAREIYGEFAKTNFSD